LAAPEDLLKQELKAAAKLVENITPWLVEFGSWLFGGLIAFNLLVMATSCPSGQVSRHPGGRCRICLGAASGSGRSLLN